MQGTMLILLMLLSSAVVFFLYYKHPGQTSVFFRTMRLSRHLYYTFIFAAGFFLGQKISGTPFSFVFFISGIFLINLLFSASLIINNIYDKKIDEINQKANALNSHAVIIKNYYIILFILACMSLVFSIIMSIKVLIAAVLISFFSYIYSSPPLRLKRVFLLNTLIISFSTILALALGFVSTPAKFSLLPMRPVVTLFAVLFLAFNTKDVNDFIGDKKYGINTIMTLFGPSKGKKITALLAFAGYLLVPILLNAYALLIPSCICGVLTYSVITSRSKKINETSVFIIFFIYAALFLFINPIR
jgi:4-hydroxybenzoate polyprenyltransferase